MRGLFAVTIYTEILPECAGSQLLSTLPAFAPRQAGMQCLGMHMHHRCNICIAQCDFLPFPGNCILDTWIRKFCLEGRKYFFSTKVHRLIFLTKRTGSEPLEAGHPPKNYKYPPFPAFFPTARQKR